jgi:hypothetical protein
MPKIKRTDLVQMRVWLYLAMAASAVAVAACYAQPATPSEVSSTQDHSSEGTKHSIEAGFLDYFNTAGGVGSLGYPLTEAIEVDGWSVQYFEYGRLEYHPENEPAYRITIGWLGDLLNRRRPPISPATIPRAGTKNSRYYPQTGHAVSGDFLRYFEAHGGSVRFGLPISEPFLWKGQLSQDFQSARFFWTPGRKEPVTLEDIGRVHLEKIYRQDKK